MAVTDIVNVSVLLAASASARPNFGIPLLLTALSGDGATPWSGAYTQTLTADGYQDTLESLGYTDSDPCWEMAELLFGQNGGEGVPERVVLGRYNDAAWVAQVTTVTITAAAEGVWTLTINGQSVTYTTDGSATIQEIRDGLDAAVDAATWGILDPTTGTVSTDGLTLTSPTPGAAFTVTLAAPGVGTATIVTGTPNTGIAADLALIEGEVDDEAAWYHVLWDEATPGLVLTLAGVVEAYPRPLHYAARSHSTIIQTVASGSANDIGWRLDDLGYARTSLWFDPAAGQYVDAAVAGFAAPYDPGTRSWHMCRLVGIDSYKPTATNVVNLTAKHVCYTQILAGNKYSTDGWVANGDYIDERIAADHLLSEVQLDLLDRLAADPQIPYTDAGSEVIRAVIDAAIRRQAYIDPASAITITIPLKSTLGPGDTAIRRWSGITFSAVLQGFVHRVVVNGTLN